MGGIAFDSPVEKKGKFGRVHDYLYDSAFIVSGARDYARQAFKAAIASAQVTVQPFFETMFSTSWKSPSHQYVYHQNCRLPDHMDVSYEAYLAKRIKVEQRVLSQDFVGKDMFKYCAVPRRVLAPTQVSPDFHPPTPQPEPEPSRPRNRGTQSVYRESSAQTTPWQPDAKIADHCEEYPEALYLDNLKWGPGRPYRRGDLPADFHTTEIINKMRHARVWLEIVEKTKIPGFMKRREEIIKDIEVKDWIFREAEIDELQEIRLSILHKLQAEQREHLANRNTKKLSKLWANKKQEMERRIDRIRKSRDREMRKLRAIHEGGGITGLVARSRAARAGGPVTFSAFDPTSDVHAPLARHGYQARNRHATIYYDPSLLLMEDHIHIADPPPWLEQCGQNLKKTCSGHHIAKDKNKLCERESKWSEQFLENLHNELKKARLGAASRSAGPLRVLRPRLKATDSRPATPTVDTVADEHEDNYQNALLLQRLIMGRAVHTLMYEGRTRAAELTEELKTTHGLQKEDRARIELNETKARDYNALRTEAELKEDAMAALVDELCGGAVSAALDFLEKELRRLKDERRQHAYILIALREKTMREAAEAGRRQKEEHRRREHDEMFKMILGVTQETVDLYLRQIVEEGVQISAEVDAVNVAKVQADNVDESLLNYGSMSTAEQNETVAELVQQFLLPEAHKMAARQRVEETQRAKLEAARKSIFGLLEDAEKKKRMCNICGAPLGELCRCTTCPAKLTARETSARDDPRWHHSRRRVRTPPKTIEQKYPIEHEMRCLLNALMYDVTEAVKEQRYEKKEITKLMSHRLRERAEITLDAMDMIDGMIDLAAGTVSIPVKESKYYHFMKRVIVDAMDRTETPRVRPCPRELPSEIRRREEEARLLLDKWCHCDDDLTKNVVKHGLDLLTAEEKARLLPSELRVLEDMRRCKCYVPHESQDTSYAATTESMGEMTSGVPPSEATDAEVVDPTEVADLAQVIDLDDAGATDDE